MTDYDALYKLGWCSGAEWGPTKRHQRRLMQVITRQLNPASIVEVGCGDGMNLVYFKTIYPQARLAGYDISPEAIRLLRERIGEGQFRDTDLGVVQDFAFSYDLVLSLDCLEHVSNDQVMIQNLFKLTSPGGHCLAMTLQGRMRGFEKSIGHVRNYARGELEKKMQVAGFQMVRRLEWGFPFFSPLYRNFLDTGSMNQKTFGPISPMKRLMAQCLYALFFLNRTTRGDYIFLLAQRTAQPQ